MGNEEDLLSKVFSTSEQEVETFADIVLKERSDDDVREACEGEPLMVKKDYSTVHQTSGLVNIEHGWHKSDYVWHIAPSHRKRLWGVSYSRVYFSIFQTMNKHFPHDLKADIFPPVADWEIPEITLKAYDLKNLWFLDQSTVDGFTSECFRVLNTLIK